MYSTVSQVKVELKIDDGTTIGSKLYNSETQISLADSVTVVAGSTTGLAAVSLPAGGELSGKVTLSGSPVGGYLV